MNTFEINLKNTTDGNTKTIVRVTLKGLKQVTADVKRRFEPTWKIISIGEKA
jgi:hypothetical protein